MRLQTHTPPPEDGDLPVRVNTGDPEPFAIIEVGSAEILADSLADCDRIIKAGAEAKRKLEAALSGTPHQHVQQDRPDGGYTSHCGHCGLLRRNEIHAVITDSERTCDERNPDGSGEPCHRGGDHGVHRDTDGEEWRTDLGTEYPTETELAAVAQASIDADQAAGQ